ncbi:glycosyltransferase family 87 protein [Flavisolibacter nicotianae]|uniref:glycosyltransferase family 87 protein n=1 Tax=Flavisolibacter nicotianae TaxID=2364882 RepID=UPI000EB531E6|nr:glycosyltransferase family 87 protein [Flavisolibacter nicotianae]
MSNKTRMSWTRNVLYNEKLGWALWFGLSLFAALQAIGLHEINNFLVYRHVYVHLIQQVNLYLPYPQEHYDVNLYGPLFGLVIAPFSWLPVNMGSVLWVLFNVSFLLFAIYQLPIHRKWKAALVVLCAHELMNASSWLQINALICGCLLLGFAYVQKEKEGHALFFIMAATFIKLLGGVGFAFFLFSSKPFRFFVWAVVWSCVFFVLPLLVVSFPYLVQSYKDWYVAILAKHEKNDSLTAPNVLYQNVSVLGMLRRIFYLPKMNDIFILLPAFAAFLSQFFPVKHYKDLRYRHYILCSVLLSTVIFNSSSESPTYIIAMPGLCLWYLLQPKTKTVNIFFAVVFFMTTFLYSDLLTPWFREHVAKPYSIKAFPSFVVWVVILVQIHKKQFLKARNSPSAG